MKHKFDIFAGSNMGAATCSAKPQELRLEVTFTDTMSSSRWGSRPDGKPYGSWTFLMPVPACPNNGLVMYRQFTEAEIKKLKSLLKTPDFQKVRNETTYYRIAWFMRALNGKDEATALWISIRPVGRPMEVQTSKRDANGNLRKA